VDLALDLHDVCKGNKEIHLLRCASDCA
jgi:hypothetical protein